jgi:hypothetical protein
MDCLYPDVKSVWSYAKGCRCSGCRRKKAAVAKGDGLTLCRCGSRKKRQAARCSDCAKPAHVITRILERVHIDTRGCWLYEGHLTLGSSGYGLIGVDRTNKVTHRLMYEELVGPVPEGLELDHLCCVTRCVNPDHLEPVTHAENCRRREQAKRSA